jgi:alpha-1,6-mannosyltransferase
MPETAQPHFSYHPARYWLPAGLIVILLPLGLLLPRHQFGWLLAWQGAAYAMWWWLYRNHAQWRLKDIIVAAVAVRLAAVFCTPQLSDDVYRFIWDGQLMAHGHNPLLSTPNTLLPSLTQQPAYFTQLHGLINHPQHYTCYPPLMQGVSWLSAQLGGYRLGGNIIVLKGCIALFDCLAVWLLASILRQLALPATLVVLYALNPTVIVEGCGNAHFETVQVACIAASIYAVLRQRVWLGAACWGLAIVTKLLPLLLLPLWIKKLGWGKGILFSLISSAVAALCFLPFVSIDFLTGFGKSLNLYFQNFEFNASAYYVARQIGWWVKGYNYIHFIGPLLMGIFLALYAVLFFVKKIDHWHRFGTMAIVVLSLYYLLATTVHPWYIINLLPFALIAGLRFPWVWAAAAFLSYHAYGQREFAENGWVIALEYGIVSITILYEWRRKRVTGILNH